MPGSRVRVPPFWDDAARDEPAPLDRESPDPEFLPRGAAVPATTVQAVFRVCEAAGSMTQALGSAAQMRAGNAGSVGVGSDRARTYGGT
jgi:hypothetical protein